jgi:SAM-dependent methyltransferase
VAAPASELFACPDCRDRLGADLRCGKCGIAFAARDGYFDLLPRAGASNPEVAGFYDENPFPNYEAMDSPRALVERARRSQFAAALDTQLPLGEPCLEAGCGTGQLSNFLALSGREMVGMDFCSASLRLGAAFRDRFSIERSTSVRGDLFHPPLRDAAFGAVLCLGVLHHTHDPRGGFRSLLACLRPGGHVVVGLYNRISRIPTYLRGVAIRAVGAARGGFLDPIVRGDRGNEARSRAWLKDQYFHPLEKSHTVGEVLRWFGEDGIEYVNAVPPIVFGEDFDPNHPLFEAGIAGNAVDHALSQWGAAIGHGGEGGLFVMIGRKR